MASRCEEVVQAVTALSGQALPDALVERDAPWPKKAQPGGQVIVRNGDPGDPEITLSPLAYTYSHGVEIEVFGPAADDDRHAALDAMLIALGEAVEADRTLGGLCEWLEPSAAEPDDVMVDHGQPLRAARLTVLAVYTTSNPLT